MASVPEFVSTEPVCVIGDIHGCRSALEELLPHLGSRPLFVIGDICDRGPDTRGVIDLLIERGARGVRGNHEEWFIDWAASGKLVRMVADGAMGSRPTFEAYGATGSYKELLAGRSNVPSAHVKWLKSLEHLAGLTVMGEKYWLVHAGVDRMHEYELGAGQTVADIVPNLYKRKSPSAHWNSSGPEESIALDRPVIMGHKCVEIPIINQRVMAIDTGAGTMQWGRLTALLLPERQTISVPAPGARL